MSGLGLGAVLWMFLAGSDQYGPERSAPVPVPDEAALPSEADKMEVSSPLSQDMDTAEVPMSRAEERVTRKPFGIRIDPATSPVQPERFRGYHTGADFEVFPEEVGVGISVRAICDGTLVAKRMADGYGGIVVGRCELGGETVTVVYGHLALESVPTDVGDSVQRGVVLGRLGAAGSTDTDGERQHLHLGIHRGAVLDIRGYVGSRAELSDWIDPCMYFCQTVSDASDTEQRVPQIILPFTAQAPAGEWSDPVFQNGCEEASILMASRLGDVTPFSIEEAKQEIRKLSKLSAELFGTAVDTSAEDTLVLFRKYTGRSDGTVLDVATDETMRSALAADQVLLVPMDGQALGNPHFTAPGPETHMLVVTGYDGATGEYVTHDPGTRFGAGYRYSKERLLTAMRDYPTGDHLPIGSVVKKAVVIPRTADQ